MACSKILTQRLVLGMLVAATPILVGCNSEKTPTTYAVKGKVIYKKLKAPVTQGTVMFQSVSEPRVLASGDLQADGTFELASDLGEPGTVEGQHKVLIQPPYLESGQKAPFHKRYASFETSKLSATVAPSDDNQVTLEVE